MSEWFFSCVLVCVLCVCTRFHVCVCERERESSWKTTHLTVNRDTNRTQAVSSRRSAGHRGSMNTARMSANKQLSLRLTLRRAESADLSRTRPDAGSSRNGAHAAADDARRLGITTVQPPAR